MPTDHEPDVDTHQQLIDFLTGTDPEEAPRWQAG